MDALRLAGFRFAFPMNPSSQGLNAKHLVSERLFLRRPTVSPNAEEHDRLIMTIIGGVVDQHKLECMARCGTKCMVCKSPRLTMAPIPDIMCHNGENSYLRISVFPFCDNWDCRFGAHPMISRGPEWTILPGSAGNPSQAALPQLWPCNVCGTTVDTRRCAMCQSVAYCGREHEMADWRTHMWLCVEWQRGGGSQAHAAGSSGQAIAQRQDGEESEVDEDDEDLDMSSDGEYKNENDQESGSSSASQRVRHMDMAMD